MADSFANQGVPHVMVRCKLGLIPPVQRERSRIRRPRRHGANPLASKGYIAANRISGSSLREYADTDTGTGQERNRGE